MMKTGTINAERTRWQFIFPEGLREEYPMPDGKITVTTYSPKWCEGIVNGFREFQRASEAYGMPAQPLPVQIQHVGIHGNTNPEERRRVGSIYDLAYVQKSSGLNIPAGVWALIEWTEEGINLIKSGKFNCLSPTNSKYGVLSTGQKIKGDFLVEVSLVDVPFLESIGTANDYLPYDYIPYSGSRTLTQSTDNLESRNNIYFSGIGSKLGTDFVISRNAQYRSEQMESEEKVEIEVSPDKITPEFVEQLVSNEKMREKMRECLREMLSEDLDSMLESRGYMKREVAAPTLPDVAQDTVESTTDIVAQARAIEEQVIGTEVKELVRNGKLLANHAAEYLSRRKSGKNIDDLIRDWNSLSVMQGVTGQVPREKKINKITENDIMKQVENELISRGKGYSYSEHLKIAKSRIAEARAKGEISEV